MLYSNYLQTSHWQEIRAKKIDHRPFCQVCGSTDNLHVHHKKYSHRGESLLFNEKLTTLVSLCSSCHKLTHHYFGISVRKLNKKFCRVRRLMELGVIKKKAFWIVATEGMWESVYPELLRRQ